MKRVQKFLSFVLVIVLATACATVANAAGQTAFEQTQYFQKVTPEANSSTCQRGEKIVFTVKFLGPGGIDGSETILCGLMPYGDGNPGWPSRTHLTSGTDYVCKGAYSYADSVFTCTVDTSGVEAGKYYFCLTYFDSVSVPDPLKPGRYRTTTTEHWLYQEVTIKGTGTPGTNPPPANTPGLTATPTSSKVYVDGQLISFDAYTINGNNYFKLRDLAYILTGSSKQFEVEWNSENKAILMTSGMPYTPVGGEMQPKSAGNKSPIPTASKILLDGVEVSFTAYTIEGNNYFKLRDIGKTFDFEVNWDGKNNSIIILTSESYTDD